MSTEFPSIDAGRAIDWSGASADYALHRPDYPDSFYRRLQAFDVGNPGQRVLDLATGVGFLAVQFARQGCAVAGVDIAPGQIAGARRRAEEAAIDADFRVAPAEATGMEAGGFDVVTAGQCWPYFDVDAVLAEARRVAPGGRLVEAYFSWLPREDPIAAASEALVLRHNPAWSAADWSGEVAAQPAWARERGLHPAAFFGYDEDIPFTRASWRGRFRACRGVGASLSPAEVDAFDADHAALLAQIAPEAFPIRHRIWARIYEL